jgi:hypothetical protein
MRGSLDGEDVQQEDASGSDVNRNGDEEQKPPLVAYFPEERSR